MARALTRMQAEAKKSQKIRRLLVHRAAGGVSRGIMILPSRVLRCALGSAGITRSKREGDGATPAGTFQLKAGYFRADRMRRPVPQLRAARPDDGWCDAPEAAVYNHPVKLPFPSRHELIWRSDHVYDVIVILDYNLRPRRRGRGSAIFFHLAHENFSPTAGCIAIRPEDMRRLLPRLHKNCVMVVR